MENELKISELSPPKWDCRRSEQLQTTNDKDVFLKIPMPRMLFYLFMLWFIKQEVYNSYERLPLSFSPPPLQKIKKRLYRGELGQELGGGESERFGDLNFKF